MAEEDTRDVFWFLCSFCPVGCYSQSDLDLHMSSKHLPKLVAIPQDPEATNLVEIPNWPVTFCERRWCCLTCGSVCEKDYHIVSHVKAKHEMSFEERKSKKRQNKPNHSIEPSFTCTLCWKRIPTSMRKDHFASEYHKARESYELGSEGGCDLCRTVIGTLDPVRTHFESDAHVRRQYYVVGSGCDVCREEFQIGMLQTRETVRKHHINTKQHRRRMTESVYTGITCDVCNVSLPVYYDHLQS